MDEMTESPMATEPDPDLLQAASILAEMSHHSSLGNDIETIVERTLNQPKPLLDGMRDLYRNLTAYFDDEPTAHQVLVAIAYGTKVDEFDLLDYLSDEDSRTAIDVILRRLSGLYGDPITRGFELASRPPLDWQAIDVTTRFEIESNRWLIDVDLELLDGERAHFVGNPLSIVRLINYLLGAIEGVAAFAEGVSDLVYDRDDVETFVERSRWLTEATASVVASEHA